MLYRNMNNHISILLWYMQVYATIYQKMCSVNLIKLVTTYNCVKDDKQKISFKSAGLNKPSFVEARLPRLPATTQ